MVYINAYAYLLAFDNETGLAMADAIKHTVTIRRAWRWLERLASVLQSARASGRLVARSVSRLVGSQETAIVRARASIRKH